MLATSRSVALIGVDAVAVEVEVDVSPGMPSFTQHGAYYPRICLGYGPF